MGTNEVSSLHPLVLSFINEKSSMDSFLLDVNRHMSREKYSDLDSIVLKLVEEWTSGDKSSWFARESVDVSNILDIVHLLKHERLFCQIVLLIPEKRKRKLILALCSTVNIVKYSQLMEHLFKETCAHYTQNFMSKITQVDASVVDTFFKNISDIFQCCATMISKNMFSVYHFIDNLLGDIAMEKYDHEPFSVLNKSGKKCIQQLQLIVGQSHTNDQMLTKSAFYHDLLLVEGYSLFLDTTLATLIPAVKEYDKGSLSLEAAVLIHRIVSKLTDLKNALSEDGCINANKSTLISRLGEVSDLLNEILLESECAGGQNTFLVFYKWKVETDLKKKLSLALECLNSLHFGYQDIFMWMLDYEDLTEKQVQPYVNHMSGHTVNFGSPYTLTKYIEKLYLLQTKNSQSYLVLALQQIIHNCIPYVSIKACNTILRNSIDWLTKSRLLLFSFFYTSKNFEASLNEVFNKLTSKSSCGDQQLFNKVSRLCLVSPLTFLEDFIHRIFANLLNHSVFRSVMVNIPALYHFYFQDVGDPGTSGKLPFLLVYTKNSWMKNNDKQTAAKNLTAILNVLLELLPEEIMDTFYHCVIDFFVYPNLISDDSFNAFLSLDLTLQVIDMLVQWPCCKVMSIKYNLTLIDFLISRLVKKYLSANGVHIVDLINSLVPDLVDLFMKKIAELPKEKLPSLDSAAEMVKKYSWNMSFYFFNLFTSLGYPFQFRIPQNLIELCPSTAPSTAIFVGISGNVNDLTNDQCAWACLFEIAYTSADAAFLLAEHIQPFDIEDEMGGLVESTALLLKKSPSIGTAKSVIAVLSQLVSQAKINDVTDFFRDELCNETQHHGMCLSMLVVIQSFILIYDTIEEAEKTLLQEECQYYTRVFHLFLQYAKNVEEVQVRSFILLYLFEQLVFSTSELGDSVKNMLLMLLMDIVVAIKDSTNFTTGDVKDLVMEQCTDVVINADGDLSLLLERLIS